jgi:isopenicillin-N epimerase
VGPRIGRRRFLAWTGAGLGAGAAAGVGLLRRAGVADAVAEAERDDWRAIRALFDLDPDRVHLAGMLLASHPRPVREAIEEHRRALDADPATWLAGGRNSRLERECREAAARYLGARPEEIALTDSTTMGLGLVYNGIRVREGQELLTTEHDYHATHEALAFQAERTGSRVRRISLFDAAAGASAGGIVDRIEAALRPATRVVALTWVHSSTGLAIPVGRIAGAVAAANEGRDAGDRAILVVDGVHGLGVLDATVDDLGCDLLVAGTHKWLCGPRGTGIVRGHPRVHDELVPVIPSFTPGDGWGGRMTPGGFHSFEHRWALAAAFELHLALGKARVEARIRALARRLKEGLAAIEGVTVVTPMADELSAGIVCFDVAGRTPGEVIRGLRERGIVGSVTPYRPPHARFSPAIFNGEEEIDRALEEVRALA